jgi:hypothetical protein
MELFIQIRNGQPYEHPIVRENFHQAYPNLNVENLPPEFARFERIPPPKLGVYEVAEGPTYEWLDGSVKDVWRVREMTDEEKQAVDDLLAIETRPAITLPGKPPDVTG